MNINNILFCLSKLAVVLGSCCQVYKAVGLHETWDLDGRLTGLLKHYNNLDKQTETNLIYRFSKCMSLTFFSLFSLR